MKLRVRLWRWRRRAQGFSTRVRRTGRRMVGCLVFPSLVRRRRKKSRNPGCYATGSIALLYPLVEAGLLPPDHDVTIHAVSGYSGGGKSLIAAHEAEGGPAFEAYALGLAHKHVPEIMLRSGLTRRPIFAPAVGHFAQGMLINIPLFL